jgi:peptide/nickel transport system substrate-binding protein
MKTLNALKVFGLLVILALTLGACAPQTPTAAPKPPTDSQPAQPGEQPEQPGEQPASPAEDGSIAISRAILLDPARATTPDSVLVNQYLYLGLVKLDANGEAQPAIAESWVVSEDRLTYIFTLRADAVFSDGAPITADDIVANFDRWLDPESPLRGDGTYDAWLEIFGGFLGERDDDGRTLSIVDGAQKFDNRTVLIHLSRPMDDLLAALSLPPFAILSPEALQDGYGTSADGLVSSGAYIVSKWDANGITLSPNPLYWDTPAEDEITFSFK